MIVVRMLGMGVARMRAVIGSDGAFFQARRRSLAGAARPRAGKRDDPGQNGAEQG